MDSFKSTMKKQIVKSLSDAIDCEMRNDDNNAYRLYAESLNLVASALMKDSLDSNSYITRKDKKNLIEFADQSVKRISFLLKKNDPSEPLFNSDCLAIPASAPSDDSINSKLFGTPTPCKIIEDQLVDIESKVLVERYQKRILSANTDTERQNLELELARQLVEKMTIIRKKFLEASTLAMEMSEKVFAIQEKLAAGTLREYDLKKQQLFALSFQYQQCNPAMDLSIKDARSTLTGASLIKELIMFVMETEGHPIYFAFNQMQKNVKVSISSCPPHLRNFSDLAASIKEDLFILVDTLKALFKEMNCEKGSSTAFKIVNELYFSPIKVSIIAVLRRATISIEESLSRCMTDSSPTSSLSEDEKREAVTKLHYLTTLTEPHDMIDCTVHILKLLAPTPFDRQHTTSIGADELLPRLCDVLIASKLPSIYSEVIFMESFMPSLMALGVGGYAVTMLRSAFGFFLKLKFDSVDQL